LPLKIFVFNKVSIFGARQFSTHKKRNNQASESTAPIAANYGENVSNNSISQNSDSVNQNSENSSQRNYFAYFNPISNILFLFTNLLKKFSNFLLTNAYNRGILLAVARQEC
jgi:hypothetical protein